MLFEVKVATTIFIMSASDTVEWSSVSQSPTSSKSQCINEDIQTHTTFSEDCNSREDASDCVESDSDVSVGGSPSFTPSHTPPGRRSSPPSPCSSHQSRAPPSPPSDDEYFKPLKKLRMIHLQKQDMASQSVSPPTDPGEPTPSPAQPQPNIPKGIPQTGVKSFSINDLLSHQPPNQSHEQSIHIALATRRIVRPWDTDEDELEEDSMSVCSSSESSSVVGSPRPASEGSATTARGKDGNPLDALFQMTSKTFNSLKNGNAAGQSISVLE